jgi:phosphoesterase RecJ-like protein
MRRPDARRNDADPADAVLRAIRAHRRFLVTTHARGDGDAIGSALAATWLLRALGKRAQVVHEGPVSEELSSLPGARTIGVGLRAVRTGYDAALVLDATDPGRCEGLQPALRGVFTINIDHHKTNVRFGDVNWVDPAAAATGELVWRLARRAGVRLDRAAATCLYAALLTDTGRFSFSNTTADTLAAAAGLLACGVRPAEVARPIYRNRSRADLRLLGACLRATRFSPDGRIGWLWLTRSMVLRAGAHIRDSQEYIDVVKSVRGVDIALLFRDTDAPGAIKVSVRSERPIDATALVAPFGGGGHPRAAGATVRGPRGAVERAVLSFARRLLREAGPRPR